MHRIFRLLTLTLLFASWSCNSSPDDSSGGSTTVQRTSPLGLGQPDPEVLFETALRDFERNDAWSFLNHFAFIDEQGKHFVPHARSGDEAPDLRNMAPLAASLRQHLSSDYALVEYGRPRNVRNDPPTVQVPMHITYQLDGLSEARKAEILQGVNRILAARHGASYRPITWDQYRKQLLNLPRQAERRFIYLDGDWRFDAGWGIDPSQR
ncbi:MAG: hypothetical protein KDB53_14370 [Planctomycetes bacterium]|nr:hypothetical protein [Planctomycetota bacterium]